MHIIIAYAITAGLWAAVSLICWSVTFPGEEEAKRTSARAFLVSPVWTFVLLWMFIGRPLRQLVIDAVADGQSSRASTHARGRKPPSSVPSRSRPETPTPPTQ